MTEAPPPAPPPPKRAVVWPTWLSRAMLEAGLVVFSVILALAGANWVEDRKTAARVDDMRGFMAEEMRQNRASLLNAYHLPHHEDLKRKFWLAGGRQSEPVNPDATRVAMQSLFASGLHPPQLKDAVWTSVSQGELIEHMSAEDVFALAEVYKAQRELEDWNDQGADAAVQLLDMMDNPVTAKLRLMRMTLFLEDMSSQERRLVMLYDRALARLDPDGATATPAKGDVAPAKG